MHNLWANFHSHNPTLVSAKSLTADGARTRVCKKRAYAKGENPGFTERRRNGKEARGPGKEVNEKTATQHKTE